MMMMLMTMTMMRIPPAVVGGNGGAIFPMSGRLRLLDSVRASFL